MKNFALVIITAAIGSQVAAAIPHRHGHQHEHDKKDLPTETITEYTTVIAALTNPAVIVWVDNEGNIVSTETVADVASSFNIALETTSGINETTTAAATTFTAPPNTPAVPVETSSATSPAAAPITSTPPTAPATSEAPPMYQAVPTSSATVNGNARIVSGGVSTVPSSGSSRQSTSPDNAQGFSGLGIGYDILDDSGNCKTASTVESDFNTFAGAYSIVRIYGTTCNQVTLVAAQAAQRGMKVFAGVNDPTGDVASAVQAIISQAGSNLDIIDTINIGNEYVNDNGAGAVPVVIAALASARAALDGIFSGHIVTVDTFDALISNPALCGASDYCAANCHAFFDPSTDAAGAGGFVQIQVGNIAAANPGKSVVITESGWAWADHSSDPNPKATEAQQVAAIASLKGSFSSNLFVFQGFNTLYKGDDYEGYFGIYDHDE